MASLLPRRAAAGINSRRPTSADRPASTWHVGMPACQHARWSSSSSMASQAGCTAAALLNGHSSCPSSRTQRSRQPSVATAAAAAPAAEAAEQQEVPLLSKLETRPIINTQGYVMPPIEPLADGGTPAGHVFAVYDAQLKPQYIGFSRDLGASLRTLVGRRPDKAHYYRALGMPALDQAAMVTVRDKWYMQLGGAPPGNKLALERNMWQQAVDAGAISARGKRGAAEEQARQLVDALKMRGSKEEWVANPTLLDEGRVDFMPAITMTPEAAAAVRAAQEASAASMRHAPTIIDGQERTFQVRYISKVKTNKGGFMVDVAVTLDNRETTHRVIIGNQYVAGSGLPGPEPATEAALSVLLQMKLTRHTDGIMAVGQFPVNYFTVSEVEQWFGDEFKLAFKIAAGDALQAGDGAPVAWRFTRMRTYGSRFMDEQERSSVDGSELGMRTSSFVFE